MTLVEHGSMISLWSLIAKEPSELKAMTYFEEKQKHTAKMSKYWKATYFEEKDKWYCKIFVEILDLYLF